MHSKSKTFHIFIQRRYHLTKILTWSLQNLHENDDTLTRALISFNYHCVFCTECKNHSKLSKTSRNSDDEFAQLFSVVDLRAKFNRFRLYFRELNLLGNVDSLGMAY